MYPKYIGGHTELIHILVLILSGRCAVEGVLLKRRAESLGCVGLYVLQPLGTKLEAEPPCLCKSV